MQLCVDIGNTSTAYAIFQEREILSSGQILANAQWEELLTEFTPQFCAVSNVSTSEKIPEIVDALNPIVIDHNSKLPIHLQYSTPHTLGSDRICAAVAAHSLYPDATVLTIDLGTCIKYELVTEDGVYEGGNIGPGMSMRYRALNRDTAKLPLISFDHLKQEIGRSTEEAIRNGVQLGMINEMEAMIDRITTLYPGLITVMTGGDLPYFENALKRPIFAHPLLVLQGLNEITLFNQSN